MASIKKKLLTVLTIIALSVAYLIVLILVMISTSNTGIGQLGIVGFFLLAIWLGAKLFSNKGQRPATNYRKLLVGFFLIFILFGIIGCFLFGVSSFMDIAFIFFIFGRNIFLPFAVVVAIVGVTFLLWKRINKKP